MSAFTVYNAGFPGDTTLELLKRFHRDVAERMPDVVCLLIGSNDMFYPGHILELDSYRKNLNTLLDRIRVIGAECVLFTAPRFLTGLLVENYPDTLQHPMSIADRLTAVNEVIRAAADERDIELVDLYKLIDPVDESAGSLIMNPANSGRRDGMHLTACGAEVMAQAAYNVIVRNFPAARRIVCLGDSITYGVYLPGKGSADSSGAAYPGVLNRLLAAASFGSTVEKNAKKTY